jgi:protein translocase SecG subunit
MDTLFSVLALIASFLLILAVIIQPGKSDMISGMAGLGGQMTNLFGVRQSRNVLQSATMILLGSIALIAILVNAFFLEEAAVGSTRQPTTQGAPMPAMPAPARQAAPAAQPAPAQQAPAQPAAPAGK